MKNLVACLLKRFKPAPLSKEQADIMASIKYPCC